MKYLTLTLATAVALYASRADSQTLKTLVQFTGTSGTATGRYACGSVTLTGTTLYGMTVTGGANGFGNIFGVGMDGTNYQNLLSFTGTGGAASGELPYGSLTVSGTTLYGMTQKGGANGSGNIFSVGTSGTNYQNLLSFTGTGGAANGRYPGDCLTLSGTSLYGTTQQGGASGFGNIFSVGANGTNFQDLLSFTGAGGAANGKWPSGSLTLSGTNLYGITASGGGSGYGNIFSLGTGGTNFQNVVSFTGMGGAASGSHPFGSLTLSGTTLYGMTSNGGVDYLGNIFSVGINGTNYHNLVSFSGTGGAARGQWPLGSLTLSGTTLFGMTSWGGADNFGNIFSVGVDGSNYRDLHSFTDGTDGGGPQGDLTLSGGTLFGMTNSGGANGDGTVFALVLPSPTPEPGTLALVATAAVASVSYRWRRKRSRRENWR